MKYLIAFLASLILLAIAPSFAAPSPDPEPRCVVSEKFAEQNKDVGFKWLDVPVKPELFELLASILQIPDEVKVTEIRFFQALPTGAPSPQTGIALGHDNIVCLWAFPPLPVLALIMHILENGGIEATPKGEGI